MILRDLAIGLILITSISFLPATLTQNWPEHAQRAVEIARDIRGLLSDIIRDATEGARNWLSDLGGVDVPELGRALADVLEARLPQDLWPFDMPGSGSDDRPGVPDTFGAARKQLLEGVYGDHRVTFYCGCRFDRGGRTDLASCGLDSLVGSHRSERVEAEHVFPASHFGQTLRCWRDPASYAGCRTETGNLLAGRACCERVDRTFATAHNDLHNLVPAVGAINAARSDYNWGELRSGQRLGDCAIRFDPILRRVQPPDAVRGDIARIMLYMRDTYHFRLSRQDEQLYAAWNNADPPDAREIERNRRIGALQGTANGYVQSYRRL
jgi:deoxyribonuclease I